MGKDDAPDFLAISFSSHDFLAHDFGPDSPEMEDAFRRLDLQIGRLLDGLDREVGKGKYVVALSADHGGGQNPELLKARRIDAGRVDGRGPVLATLEAEADAALGPADWFAGYWTPGLFASPAGKAKIHTADARIIAAGRKLEGVAEVLSLPELVKPGTHGALGDLYRHGIYPGRSPDFIIVPRPFWMYGTKDMAAHGTPWLYDRAVPLVLFGGPIKKGELELADAVDVAVTLAALVGSPPPPAAIGRVLVPIR
jgi:arylsulfatase A-like enzyme